MPNPLIVAADLSDLHRAEALAASLAGRVAYVKVGLELFVAAGPPAVTRVRSHGPVFLDLKLHDIPHTVARAARNAGRLGAELLTVHALGGMTMIEAAVVGAAEGAAEAGFAAPAIIAVTVLSSLSGKHLASAASLAVDAVSVGADGVVVSGEDVATVREILGPTPLVVVPGIRPEGSSKDDQVRVLTPAQALARGADLIVVGRPVTGAQDPAAAVEAILRDIAAA